VHPNRVHPSHPRSHAGSGKARCAAGLAAGSCLLGLATAEMAMVGRGTACGWPRRGVPSPRQLPCVAAPAGCGREAALVKQMLMHSSHLPAPWSNSRLVWAVIVEGGGSFAVRGGQDLRWDPAPCCPHWGLGAGPRPYVNPKRLEEAHGAPLFPAPRQWDTQYGCSGPRCVASGSSVSFPRAFSRPGVMLLPPGRGSRMGMSLWHQG